MDYYMGIDIGILNLAIVLVQLQNNKHIEVKYVERINLTKLKHEKVPFHNCKLHHTKALCDRVNHFIQEYKELFDKSKLIFIEQQPIFGITSVEQLLMNKFRDKTKLISPIKMHQYFKIHKIKDYNLRKEKTVKYADEILGLNFEFYNREIERKHDIADALCIVTYACQEIIRKHKIIENNDFEQFKFNKNRNN